MRLFERTVFLRQFFRVAVDIVCIIFARNQRRVVVDRRRGFLFRLCVNRWVAVCWRRDCLFEARLLFVLLSAADVRVHTVAVVVLVVVWVVGEVGAGGDVGHRDRLLGVGLPRVNHLALWLLRPGQRTRAHG